MAVQLSHLTPELVNRRYPEAEFLVTKEEVEKLFKCLSYPYSFELGDEIPHAFYACLREREFHVFNDLGIDLKQLLHVSQSFSYFAHLKVGDKVKSRVSIEKVNSRKLGGNLVVFIELKNQYFRNEELVAVAEGHVIAREA